jgi:hypothetical protein
MYEYCNSNGIVLETTDRYTPELNGKAERNMRTIVEMVRVSLTASKLLKELWNEALLYCVYTNYYLPTSSNLNNAPPFEMWTGNKLKFSHLYPFGCLAIKVIPKENRTKLDVKGKQCIFMGYDITGYRLIMPKTARVAISRHAQIFEKKSASWLIDHNEKAPLFETAESTDDDPDTTDFNLDFAEPVAVDSLMAEVEDEYIPDINSDVSEAVFDNLEPAALLRRLSRIPVPVRRFTANAATTSENHPVHFSVILVPETFKDVHANPFREEWWGAMSSKIDSLRLNGSWVLVPP